MQNFQQLWPDSWKFYSENGKKNKVQLLQNLISHVNCYCWVDLEEKLTLTDKILSTQIHLQVVQVQNAVLLKESCCLNLIFVVWQWLTVILCKLYL